MIFSLSFFTGATTWSLCEYVLHRFVGHSKKRLGGFTTEHRSHHIDGNHFMPLRKKIRISCTVLLPLFVVSMLILGHSMGTGFSFGFAAFFFVYECVHKRAHSHPPKNAYGRWLRRHHFFHHFAAPHKNFGVTSPIWDVVFRTYVPAGMIRLPASKAMPWLIDTKSNQVYPEFSQDYQLKVRRKNQKKSS